MTPPRRPYQDESLAYLLDHPRTYLADEPGLGKTRVLLEAARGRTLVVSAAMLQDVWETEHAKWAPELELSWTSYSTLYGRQITGVSRLGHPVHTGVPRARPELLGYDTVIFDEAHEIKNRKALQTAAALQIAKRAPRLYLSTGTPIPNWGHEIFTGLQAIYGTNDRRFSNYWRWVGRWFEVNVEAPKKRGGKAHRVVGDLHPLATWEAFAEQNGIEGHWIRHLRADVLADLPPLTHQVISVPMVTRQAKAYKEFERNWFTKIDDHELVTWSAGGKYTQLLQLATGLETVDPELVGSGKLDTLQEILRERTTPTLVFAWFRASVEAADRRAREMGLRSAFIHGGNKTQHRAILQRWRAGELDVLAGSIRMLKEGLTLTEADTVVFVERSAVPSHNEQAMRRIHRLGQTRPCLSIDLVSRGTVDARLRALLEGKTDQQAKVITAFDLVGRGAHRGAT